jgi:hypothetical protein
MHKLAEIAMKADGRVARWRALRDELSCVNPTASRCRNL